MIKIVSQDRKRIVDCKAVFIDMTDERNIYASVGYEEYKLGTYSEEKALRLMKNIIKHIDAKFTLLFYMPLENDYPMRGCNVEEVFE